MELGAGTAGIIDDYSTGEKFREMAQLGLDFVEVSLAVDDPPDVESIYLDLMQTSQIPVRSAVLAEFVRLPDLGAGAAAALMTRLHELVALAARLDCDVVLLPVTLPPGEPARAPRYAEALHDLTGTADRSGLVLAAEFVGGTPPARAAQLVATVDSRALKLYFDIGNCLYAGVDPVASLEAFLPLVAQVHIKGGPETPMAALPFDRLREVLVDGGFGGRCCVEIEPAKGRSALRDAVGVLRMHGFWRPAAGNPVAGLGRIS